MNFVLVDPFLIYSPIPSQASSVDIDNFVESLNSWSDFARDQQNIQFRLSRQCRNALSNSPGYPLGVNSLSELLQRSARYRGMERVVLDSAMHFLNNVFKDPFIDEEIERHQTDIQDWKIASDTIVAIPSIFAERLPNPELKLAFLTTLADLACSENEIVKSSSQGDEVWIASPSLVTPETQDEDTPNQEQSAEKSQISIKVNAKFTVIVGDEISDEDRLIEETFSVAHSPGALDFPPDNLEFDSVLDALRAAVNKYPDILVSFPLTERSAKESGYEDPKNIYDHIVGLVEVWLPIFKVKGGEEAGRIYHEKYSRYKQDESETAKNKFASDYTVTFQDKPYFCGRHIMIGTGINCVRINFEVVQVDDSHKILLARAGKHGRTKRRPT